MHIQVEPPGSAAQPVLVAPGLLVMSPRVARVEDADGFDLEATVVGVPFDGERAGRFICRSLRVTQRDDGPPVTSEAIRGIPVGLLVRDVGALIVESVESLTDTTVAVCNARITPEMAERFRREGPTSEVLAWVARVYRLAVVLRDPPTRAVEEAFGVPRSTAGRWVAAARVAGYLAAAEGAGKAGG